MADSKAVGARIIEHPIADGIAVVGDLDRIEVIGEVLYPRYGPNADAFGHSGWGGSFGCADPAKGVAIGYVCNQMGPELVGDPRTAGLCQAILQAP